MFNAITFAESQLAKPHKKPPGKNTALAYSRFLFDLKNKRLVWKYDANLADVRIKLIEKVVLQDDGIRKGKPFQLMDWQKFTIHQIYGWVAKGEAKGFKERRFREAYIEIAKKNGKTTFIAVLCIASCILDSYIEPSIYCFASTQMQAEILISRIKKLTSVSPVLKTLFKDRVKKVIFSFDNRNGFIEAIPGRISAREGILPSLCVLDEFHHHSDTMGLDTLKGSMMSAGRNPLTLIITTAGVKAPSPCYDYRERYLTALFSKNKKAKRNERQFTYVFSIDEEDNWKNNEIWYKANPSVDSIVEANALIDKYMGVDGDSDLATTTFKALHLCLWAQGGSQSFISVVDWQRLAYISTTDNVLDIIKKRKDDVICVMGVDLSAVNDFTSACLLAHDKEEGVWWMVPFIFCTQKRVNESIGDLKMGVDLRKYVQSGDIIVVGEERIDEWAVINFIKSLHEEVSIRAISYDRSGASFMFATLRSEMDDIEYFPVPGNSWISFGETKRLLTTGALRHTGSELMAWQISNVHVRLNTKGQPLIDKSRARNSVDSVLALTYAVDSAIRLGFGLFPDAEKSMADYHKKIEKDKNKDIII